MFRVADIREYAIIDPKIRGSLYIWGPGRNTAEGEHVPLDVQQLDMSSYDDLFVVPTLVEHVIDESSPLFGHTRETLEVLAAGTMCSWICTFVHSHMCRSVQTTNSADREGWGLCS